MAWPGSAGTTGSGRTRFACSERAAFAGSGARTLNESTAEPSLLPPRRVAEARRATREPRPYARHGDVTRQLLTATPGPSGHAPGGRPSFNADIPSARLAVGVTLRYGFAVSHRVTRLGTGCRPGPRPLSRPLVHGYPQVSFPCFSRPISPRGFAHEHVRLEVHARSAHRARRLRRDRRSLLPSRAGEAAGPAVVADSCRQERGEGRSGTQATRRGRIRQRPQGGPVTGEGRDHCHPTSLPCAADDGVRRARRTRAL